MLIRKKHVYVDAESHCMKIRQTGEPNCVLRDFRSTICTERKKENLFGPIHTLNILGHEIRENFMSVIYTLKNKFSNVKKQQTTYSYDIV